MRIVPSTKAFLRELANQALKVAGRRRKNKIVKVVPEGESGKTGEWNGRKSFKKLGKRKFKKKLAQQQAYRKRMTAMDGGKWR